MGVCRVKERKTWGLYDERQTAVRGRAFKWGFITLIVLLFAYMYGLESWSWMDPMVGCAMCVFAGIGVFMGISVYGGAYYWMSTENTKGGYVGWLIIAALDMASVIIGNDLFEHGQIGTGTLRLETAIIFFAMAAVDIAARIRNKRRENEAEE